MIKRITLAAFSLLFAFAVLLMSVFRTAEVKYDFSKNGIGNGNETQVLGEEIVDIKYNLAFPGKVLPDSPLWPVKAARDKAWLTITTNPSRRAELLLLFSDKRIASSEILFENEKYDVGFATLTKAEKYLEEACSQETENREQGLDTDEFLKALSLASLKHYEVIDRLITKAPEEMRPQLIQMLTYSNNAYEKTKHALNNRGIDTPIDPFDRQ